MKLADLFQRKVTRPIPPVVYFHEQSPVRLADEVSEYIITGGYPESHPHHKRVPNGIHDQYVRLLAGIESELDKKGGPENPASWISGFYGSGKSSFAKLFGLALDGIALPDGRSLAEALLARDQSPKAAELRDAYQRLRAKVDPIAVVFDIGGVARDREHIHSAIVREVQRRLGYCADPHVAEMELKLERDGHWARFEEVSRQALGRAWDVARREAMADDHFSTVMHHLFPDRYLDPMAWIVSRAGTFSYSSSASDAVRAIADMLQFRAREPKATLFIVVDEVSQYVHQDEQRMLALQSFVSELGSRLRGKAWLLATGQQKLEEGGDASTIGKMKARFPEKLRVHLSATNIRDVVHKRLLAKEENADKELRALFKKHRNDLKLFAYDCENVSEDDFVECYPLLPGHIDLILQITSALRLRSSRSQGDDQAIRGLLQLLGELFRGGLADAPIRTLVTLDRIYDIQHTALDSDVQASMARVQNHCATRGLDLALRAARAVALLQLIQETVPTDAKLVAQCLHDSMDANGQLAAVTDALEELRRANLLGYSEKHGYKLQSPAGEEWERDRADISVPREQIARYLQEALKLVVAGLERPKLEGRPFPWLALFSDGRQLTDTRLADPRDPASITIDFRFVPASEREPDTWINRSGESSYEHRILWVVGASEELEQAVREYGRSEITVRRYKARSESLPAEKKRLLLEEEGRAETLLGSVQRELDAAWLAGRLYFGGKAYAPRDLGSSAAMVLARAADRFLRDLFPHFVSVRISSTEVLQLIEKELNAPSPKFIDDLGILTLESGKYVPSCSGLVPRRVLEQIEKDGGTSGAALLAFFGGPPFGYAPEVVRACVAGLLRGSKIRIRPESGGVLTAARDAGVRDVLEKDREFKAATFEPVGTGGVELRTRARICKFFEEKLGLKVDRENDAIANKMSEEFPRLTTRLREVFDAWRRLPGGRQPPEVLVKLDEALTHCYGLLRETESAVRAVERKLDVLNDGVPRLNAYASELTTAVIDQVRRAEDVCRYQLAQLEQLGEVSPDVAASAGRIRAQLTGEHPWRGIGGIDGDLDTVRAAYVEQRRAILATQTEAAEAARQRIKMRDGFATLPADKSHYVLRPISEALTPTDDTAISPGLLELRDGSERALQRAVIDAGDRLDAVLSEGTTSPIRKVMIGLHDREIRDEAELERVLDELRTRILEQLKAGGRVRLV